MREQLQCISPIDGSVYLERALADSATIAATLQRAARAQRDWRRVDLAERQAILSRFVDLFTARNLRDAG